jgi:hypothetical protein
MVVQPVMVLPPTREGKTQGQPGRAPPTVRQAEGGPGAGPVYCRGHTAESAIRSLTHCRLEVTRCMTEGSPAWHPFTPQLTTPIVS